MDLVLLLTALILGVVEGLTEFLPVSSTGHLIIIGDFLGFTGAHAKTFEIFIQLGAILAVVWHYRQRLASFVAGLNQGVIQRFWLNLTIAFVPAALVGLALHKQIKAYLFNPMAVAGALIVGGVIILLIERTPRRARVQDLESLRPSDALKIGVAQTLSLFPGVSRAGATIMGGLLTGLSRTTATEFSFFLAIPTMLAATSYELIASRHVLSPENTALFTVGFVTAFVTALIVIRAFLAYVAHHNFAAFAYYRIVFGLLVLIYFW
ncbi:MAG: undecaprenyl-diphosphate phosphatase [Gammaproteobacteria bacterium]|jgi:undecaprenyl-diphosphatase|nr:undecaprenyl-diphosphate phosphatase [Pseudomonadota bacterium]MCZ6732484.1 undecaprenyl-diphosphate phosphatase [Gammaproteobacteria bacterium]